MSIEKIFPIEIYKTIYKKNLNLQEPIENISDDVTRNIGNYLSTNKNVLFLEEFVDIKLFIEEHLKIYYKHLYNIDNNINPYITNSWITFNGKNDFHHVHSHSNSIISGVFYINVSEESDCIRFVHPIKSQLMIGCNEHGGEYIQTVCNNFLIMFPSYLEHYVPPINYEKYTRISLSFNSFVNGTIGSNDGANQLILNK